nr:PREDICTED: uncharacterized protein LOC107080087 [Lepisosteus oculatus]
MTDAHTLPGRGTVSPGVEPAGGLQLQRGRAGTGGMERRRGGQGSERRLPPALAIGAAWGIPGTTEKWRRWGEGLLAAFRSGRLGVPGGERRFLDAGFQKQVPQEGRGVRSEPLERRSQAGGEERIPRRLRARVHRSRSLREAPSAAHIRRPDPPFLARLALPPTAPRTRSAVAPACLRLGPGARTALRAAPPASLGASAPPGRGPPALFSASFALAQRARPASCLPSHLDARLRHFIDTANHPPVLRVPEAVATRRHGNFLSIGQTHWRRRPGLVAEKVGGEKGRRDPPRRSLNAVLLEGVTCPRKWELRFSAGSRGQDPEGQGEFTRRSCHPAHACAGGHGCPGPAFGAPRQHGRRHRQDPAAWPLTPTPPHCRGTSVASRPLAGIDPQIRYRCIHTPPTHLPNYSSTSVSFKSHQRCSDKSSNKLLRKSDNFILEV